MRTAHSTHRRSILQNVLLNSSQNYPLSQITVKGVYQEELFHLDVQVTRNSFNHLEVFVHFEEEIV